MPILDMEGPYVLDPIKIDRLVAPKVPGNYAVGYIAGGDFIVLYIGRSDDNLNRELKNWVFRKSDCLFFKFSCANSSQEAFKKECTNYHNFGGSVKLKNKEHPQKPANTDWTCPHCNELS